MLKHVHKGQCNQLLGIFLNDDIELRQREEEARKNRGKKRERKKNERERVFVCDQTHTQTLVRTFSFLYCRVYKTELLKLLIHYSISLISTMKAYFLVYGF